MFPISSGIFPLIPQDSAEKYSTVKFPMDLGSLDSKLFPDTSRYVRCLQLVSEVRKFISRESSINVKLLPYMLRNTRNLKYPKELGTIPLNSLSPKLTLKRFEALDIVFGIFPTNLFPYIARNCRLGSPNPKFDGSMPEKEFSSRRKYSNVDMLKTCEGIGPLKLLLFIYKNRS